MKAALALFALATAVLATTQTQTSSTDERLIDATIRDYIEGFYTGDVARVKSAFSADLAKRVVGRDKDGKDALKHMSLDQLLKMTETQGTAKSYPEGKRKLEIKIFEIDGKAASAKAVAQEWVDYIHLGKVDGKWVIVNVLWK